MAIELLEDIITKKLTGEPQNLTMDFVLFMKENGFSFEGFDAGGSTRWNPIYNGKGFGCVAVEDCFMFWLGLDWSFDDSLADDELKNFAWEHTVVCPQEKYCKPPYCEASKNQWQIFGKKFESTCHAPLAFFAPDAEALEKIKKLLLMTR